MSQKSVGNTCSRTEHITLPNQDMLSTVMVYIPFLCCIAYNRRHMILQHRPCHCRTNVLSEPVNSSSSEQDDIMLSEPTGSPVPEGIRTEKRIKKQSTLKRVAYLSLMSSFRLKIIYHFMAWNLYRQDMKT